MWQASAGEACGFAGPAASNVLFVPLSAESAASSEDWHEHFDSHWNNARQEGFLQLLFLCCCSSLSLSCQISTRSHGQSSHLATFEIHRTSAQCMHSARECSSLFRQTVAFAVCAPLACELAGGHRRLQHLTDGLIHVKHILAYNLDVPRN